MEKQIPGTFHMLITDTTKNVKSLEQKLNQLANTLKILLPNSILEVYMIQKKI